jgi:hypothetical protein
MNFGPKLLEGTLLSKKQSFESNPQKTKATNLEKKVGCSNNKKNFILTRILFFRNNLLLC